MIGNEVADNVGSGLWCDINCYEAEFAHNTVTGNGQPTPDGRRIGVGIFCEISDRSSIHDNTVTGNGPLPTTSDDQEFWIGAQILLSATANSRVWRNTVSGANGIGIMQQERTDSCRFCVATRYPDGTRVCPFHVAGHPIHWAHGDRIWDNTLTETAPAGHDAELAGEITDLPGACAACWTAGNHFTRNRYVLPASGGHWFMWRNRSLTRRQWIRAGQS